MLFIINCAIKNSEKHGKHSIGIFVKVALFRKVGSGCSSELSLLHQTKMRLNVYIFPPSEFLVLLLT